MENCFLFTYSIVLLFSDKTEFCLNRDVCSMWKSVVEKYNNFWSTAESVKIEEFCSSVDKEPQKVL